MKNIQMRLYLGLMIINLDNLHNKVNFKLEINQYKMMMLIIIILQCMKV